MDRLLARILHVVEPWIMNAKVVFRIWFDKMEYGRKWNENFQLDKVQPWELLDLLEVEV